MEILEQENTRISREFETMHRDLKQMQNEKQQLEKKLAQAVAKATKAATELKTEADTNAILRDDQQKWASHVGQLEEKLKDTVRSKDKVSQFASGGSIDNFFLFRKSPIFKSKFVTWCFISRRKPNWKRSRKTRKKISLVLKWRFQQLDRSRLEEDINEIADFVFCNDLIYSFFGQGPEEFCTEILRCYLRNVK